MASDVMTSTVTEVSRSESPRFVVAVSALPLLLLPRYRCCFCRRRLPPRRLGPSKIAPLHPSSSRCAPLASLWEQLAAFTTGAVEVLVATDVAARGLDVPEVAHVVQVLLLARVPCHSLSLCPSHPLVHGCIGAKVMLSQSTLHLAV